MKKRVWVSLLAALTALIGVAAVVVAFFRKKGKRLKDDLDFDDSVYFDDDDTDESDLLLDGDEYEPDAVPAEQDAGTEPEKDDELDLAEK